METFLDGGLFEILFAIGIAYTLNFIFKKKFLLIIFSIVSVVATVLIFIVKSNEIFYFVSTILAFNSILLISILWKLSLKEPDKPLFEVSEYIQKYNKIKESIKKILF